ncbi:hypothetical protein QBC37DRAFT_371956 [Rhypophila decipiens]|uniref:Uncharacterized protein n=1 Tax=Rhypophila decipiens TaxID=261697 RepID=A0AAN6YBB8_9PEZI|nr:hypothetical protein QBC37DRAFT_371956 [Rhypophila decipiens]
MAANLDVASRSCAKKRGRDDDSGVRTRSSQSAVLPALRPELPSTGHLQKKRRTMAPTDGWADSDYQYRQTITSPRVNGATSIDETDRYWFKLVSVLALLGRSTARPHSRPREFVPYPGHWEIVPSYLDSTIGRSSTVKGACASLVNDQTSDLRILCQKLGHLSNLIQTSDRLNLELIDIAVLLTLTKILDSMSNTKWPGVDIRAVTFAMRQVLHSASCFGETNAWYSLLVKKITQHQDFKALEETRCWSKFGPAMDRGKHALWNHFSLVGMLGGEEKGWNTGFIPCMGHGWVVADFEKHRLFFLREDSVTVSTAERYGTFAMVFNTPGSSSTHSHPPIVFPEVSARQLQKRSKFGLEEWYKAKMGDEDPEE